MYGISTVSYYILFYIVRYRRKVVFTNIRKSFPNKSKQEVHHIAHRFYRHFCDVMFETSKLLTISQAQLRRRYKIRNPEILEPYFENGQSAILYAGHFGNWEWLSIMPTYIDHQMLSLYAPLSNRHFDKLVRKTRERFGNITVKSASAYKQIMTYQRDNVRTLTYIIGDQRPSPDSCHWVSFMHQDTPFFIGADRIARKTNQPVFFLKVKKVKRGHYVAELIPLAEQPAELAPNALIEGYADTLEKAIEASPELWFMVAQALEAQAAYLSRSRAITSF